MIQSNLSCEELIKQINELNQELNSIKKSFSEELNDRKSIEFALQKRIKELNCHNQISEMMSVSGISTSEIIEKIVNIIPPSWQFPELAQACIVINDQTYQTSNYRKSAYTLSQSICSNGVQVGYVEVCYPEDQLPQADLLFLPEETHLLFSIAVRIGNHLEKSEKDSVIHTSQEKYRELVESISEIIYEFSSDGIINYISPAVEYILGYHPQELIGKSVFDIVHADDKMILAQRLSSVELTPATSHEYRFMTKTGNLLWLSKSTTTIHQRDKSIYRIGTLTDITQRKLAQKEIQDLNTSLELKIEERTAQLAESNLSLKKEIEERKIIAEALQTKTRELENFFSVALDLLCIADVQGNFIRVNKAWETILGYSASELEKRKFLEFVHPDDIQSTLDAMSVLSEQHPILNFTNRYRCKDGSYRFIEWRSSPSGQLIYAAARDITERIASETAAKNARKEAEEANQAKSEFLSRMSHELRTPMNAILGFAQLLEMGQLNAAQRKGVDHILRGGKHLLDLINEVLDISRIESGRLSLSSEPVKLKEVLEEMIDTVSPLAQSREIGLYLNESPEIDTFVKADRQRLKQVLLNLINNAIKYNQTGGKVNISVQISGEDHCHITKISITDTGIGIKQKDLPKLFKPFERIGAEQSETEGSGLGLAVVKKLMEAMHGRVGIESKYGKGSTFWIELPSCDDQLKQLKASTLLAKPDAGLNTKSGTILYIEDNVSNIELVEQILLSQRPNIRLISNPSGKMAVSLGIDHQPDLIFLDLNLPDMDGGEVIKLLQENENTKHIPVVVISADAMPIQLARMLKNGAKKYLTKPLDIPEFLNVLDSYINE